MDDDEGTAERNIDVPVKTDDGDGAYYQDTDGEQEADAPTPTAGGAEASETSAVDARLAKADFFERICLVEVEEGKRLWPALRFASMSELQEAAEEMGLPAPELARAQRKWLFQGTSWDGDEQGGGGIAYLLGRGELKRSLVALNDASRVEDFFTRIDDAWTANPDHRFRSAMNAILKRCEEMDTVKNPDETTVMDSHLAAKDFFERIYLVGLVEDGREKLWPALVYRSEEELHAAVRKMDAPKASVGYLQRKIFQHSESDRRGLAYLIGRGTVDRSIVALTDNAVVKKFFSDVCRIKNTDAYKSDVEFQDALSIVKKRNDELDSCGLDGGKSFARSEENGQDGNENEKKSKNVKRKAAESGECSEKSVYRKEGGDNTNGFSGNKNAQSETVEDSGASTPDEDSTGVHVSEPDVV
ncbi:hypothetical protein ACHAWF_001084, partial [Thalassiosira exigua]